MGNGTCTMIVTEQRTSANPATVHGLLVDVDSWSLWSPHVASVDGPSRFVYQGWSGATRAFFAPGATSMTVDEVRTNGGYRWHSSLGPWRLHYNNLVEAGTGGGSTVRFVADLQGPASTVIERLVAPISALGQRRRIARLVALAELMESQTRPITA